MSQLAKAGPAIAVGFFAAFGGFLFGYDTGTISGIIAMDPWLRKFGVQASDGTYFLPSTDKSLVVSILALGEFIGALAGAPVSDSLGRKYGISVACIVFSIGVAMQTAGTNLAVFIVGRVIAGLGVGLISCLVPLYQSECAPKWIRGGIVAAYQWFITIGLLLASVANNFGQYNEGDLTWRLPIGIQLAFGALLGIGMLFLPESPRFLIKKGNTEAALKSLAILNNTDVNDIAVKEAFQEITENFEQEKSFGSVSYLDCFKNDSKSKIGLRTHTGIWLQAFQQLTGINFIFYFGTTFFKSAGINDPFLIGVITNVVNVVSTIPGMYGVDVFGRRQLLLIGAAGMCICEFIVAIVGTVIGTEPGAGQVVLIVFVCLYIFFFAASWGPIAWIVTGEIYPLNVRAKAMSMSTASNWLWNFIIGFITPYMVDAPTPVAPAANLGVKVFFIWGTTCALCFVYAYFMVAETKGLSLEQVDELYIRTTPVNSDKIRRELMTEHHTHDDLEADVQVKAK
ncbi:MFS monosaccharide transporter [Cladochytrium replicatum]|nr:MFS monosaccharide transporter [Cladochytrium replicatum]